MHESTDPGTIKRRTEVGLIAEMPELEPSLGALPVDMLAAYRGLVLARIKTPPGLRISGDAGIDRDGNGARILGWAEEWNRILHAVRDRRRRVRERLFQGSQTLSWIYP